MSCIFFCFFSFISSSSSLPLPHYHQQTSSNIVLKKKYTFHLLSNTLGVFYYFTVVVYEYIYIYLILLIYIFIIIDDFSLFLFLFFSLDQYGSKRLFFILICICILRKKNRRFDLVLSTQ